MLGTKGLWRRWDGQQVEPASPGLLQAALCRDSRGAEGERQEACGPVGPPDHSPLLSPGSGVHLRLHRGDPHPVAAPVPPGPHVLPVPLLLPLVPDPQPDRPPPYFSSSQRLVGPQRGASRLESAAENPGMQGDELFCVGPPSTYRLPSWEQPRLPSYESVRKKDRQREIHQMIAERFGLWAEPSQEMPPPYEHALRHPPAFSGSGISSETLDRCGVPDPFHAPLSYQTQRNTAV
ncbi:uncharacterized protein LOC135424578 isoform X1 [Pseudopipra pipra]|uniref:uncharacterized protein LOC135424578 isoform X1 n=1 Tax=Pseudopipra pipra TaxID=415032 RepID=UPI0031387AF3